MHSSVGDRVRLCLKKEKERKEKKRKEQHWVSQFYSFLPEGRPHIMPYAVAKIQVDPILCNCVGEPKDTAAGKEGVISERSEREQSSRPCA